MPTSPKTAKEIIQEIESNQRLQSNPNIKVRLSDSMKEALLSAMRAAVEAVLDVNIEYGDTPMVIKVKIDNNVSRFFNDDPTSPPTPRN